MKEKLRENIFFNEFISITSKYEDFKRKSIPLCAAENITSNFVKIPISSSAQEKYVMGGMLEFIKDYNFIGGEKIFEYYNIIHRQCNKLYGNSYTDARTLTGMNAVTTLLMSLTKAGDTILFSSPNCGGHASIPDICRRLGLNTIELPYNYENLDFDYPKINELLKENNIQLIFFCLSDIINIPNFGHIININNIPLIYDATQTLGLIAGKVVENPLNTFTKKEKFILMGATHKTIPGPSASLIMTKNDELAKIIEKSINPMYLRNTQMNQKMCLIFALLELEYFGEEYMHLIVDLARKLAHLLSVRGFKVLNQSKLFTSTHQIHITCSKDKMLSFYENCDYYNVTLNFKEKAIFSNFGIRIGTQEIARYKWGDREIKAVADLLELLYNHKQAYKNELIHSKVQLIIANLIAKKTIHFTFGRENYSDILKELWIEKQ